MRVKRHKSPTNEHAQEEVSGSPPPPDALQTELARLAKEHPAYDPHPTKTPNNIVDRPRFHIQQPRKMTN
jgi:hypothetical protein